MTAILAVLILAGIGVALLALENAGGGGGVPVASNGASSPVLSSSDLAALARGAGFFGEDVVTAVAVALAESGGNPSAYNPETAAGTPEGKGSYGLWQIYLKAHPEFSGFNLFNPVENACAAYRVWQDAGGSFQPWSTFKGGQYLAYLPAAREVSA